MTGLTRADMNCLACSLNPLSRADVDGLCVSCRFAVADTLLRVEWVYLYGGGRYRVLVWASASEHPLGCEFPDRPDPVRYRPELLPGLWRRLERQEADDRRAADTLDRLERGA